MSDATRRGCWSRSWSWRVRRWQWHRYPSGSEKPSTGDPSRPCGESSGMRIRRTMSRHASSALGRRGREIPTVHTFDELPSSMGRHRRGTRKAWRRVFCSSSSGRDIDPQRCGAPCRPYTQCGSWDGYRRSDGNASGASPVRRWLPRETALTQAPMSCRSWPRPARLRRTGLSSPPPSSPSAASRAWGKSRLSGAPACGGRRWLSGASKEIRAGFPVTSAVLRASGPTGYGASSLDGTSWSTEPPSSKRVWPGCSKAALTLLTAGLPLARAGAAFLRFRGLPWRYLCWWGRWASVRMAHFYAAAPEDFTFHASSRLPWPTSHGVKWITTDTAEFWPSSLMGLCVPDERPAKLPATGSKRDRGSEAMVDGDDSGDAVQPPTAKRPSRPAPPRKPSRRTGQSTPSGPSVATSQSASTTERRTVPSSPARDSPPGGPTGEGVAPDSSITAPAPESGSAVRAGGSPQRQSVAAKFKGRARDHQRTAPVVRGGDDGSGLLRLRSRGRGLGAPVELPPGTAMAGSRVRRLKGASRGQGSRQVPDPIIIDEG